MRTFFLMACAVAGWWVSRNDGLACEIGVAIVITGVGWVLCNAIQISIKGLEERWQARRVLPPVWTPTAKGASDLTRQTTEWHPVQDSPEDPHRNPYHSPDHQNTIDPDHWI